jgi:hypothetical protein
MCRNIHNIKSVWPIIHGYLLARSQKVPRKVSASFLRAVLTLFQPPHLDDTPRIRRVGPGSAPKRVRTAGGNFTMCPLRRRFVSVFEVIEKYSLTNAKRFV